MKYLALFLSLLALSFSHDTLRDRARQHGEFSTLLTALEITGLDEELANEQQLTIFAPTDEAFENLPPGALDELLKNPEDLSQLLLGHVLEGVVTSEDIENNAIVEAVGGQQIRTNVYEVRGEQVITINGVEVLQADIEAENGIIHKVDRVLPFTELTLVEVVQEHPQLTQLASILENFDNLVEDLGEGEFTLFAPTDEAFAALPQRTADFLLDPKNENVLLQVLLFHVSEDILFSPGLTDGVRISTLADEVALVTEEDCLLFVEGQRISNPDILAVNGVIHKLDGILIPSNVEKQINSYGNKK